MDTHEEISLEAVHVCSREKISDIGNFKFDLIKTTENQLIASLKSYIWSEKRDDIEYVKFESGWDHLKFDLVRKFSVLGKILHYRMKVIRVRVYDLYPKLKFRESLGDSVRVLVKTEGIHGCSL